MKKDNFTNTLMYVINKLHKIPEVAETITIVKSNNGIKTEFADNPINYIKVIFIDYLGVIRSLTNLSDDDVKLVKRINTKRRNIGLDTNPLGHHGIDVLYNKLNKKDRSYYWQSLITSLDIESVIFKAAVYDLTERMKLASKLAKDGVVLEDGDPRADKVIWGHTKGLKPEATIHFVICHLIDRLTFQIFHKSRVKQLKELVSNKHYLFDPLGDIIFLLTAKKMINLDISRKWESSRENGGLSWNTPEEQKVFNDEFSK